MVSRKQKEWRKKFAILYGRKKIRGENMRRRSSRRRGGGGGLGINRLFSMKNVMLTAAGAILAPKILGIDGKLGAAAGGFLGAGIAGAAAGYLLGGTLSHLAGSAVKTAATWTNNPTW